MSNMLEIYRAELVKHGVFTNSINPLVDKCTTLLPEEIPYHLRLGISVSELVSFASHFRRSIELYDGTLVPVNAITMLLFSSGISKDSSLNMIRKALNPAYSILEEERNSEAQERAEAEAMSEADDITKWTDYFVPPASIRAGLGTPEGLVKSFSRIEKGKLGAASMVTSEVGSELQTNPNFTEIVKQISIGYDLGKIPAKLLVSDDNQLPDIKGLPINALMFGSEDGILYDNSIKNKFRLLFNTQLARRSIFAYSPEPAKDINLQPDEMFAYREAERERTIQLLEEVQEATVEVFDSYEDKSLYIPEETQRLFDIYKEYNTLLSNSMTMQYSISKLSRKHKQWLSLKLAGAYAILNGNDSVTQQDYVHAINTVEEFANDLLEFEKSLVLEQYEVFVKYCQHNCEDNKLSITLHQLKKLQFITGSGTKPKMEELVRLANSKDSEGVYSVCDGDSICYERLVKSDTITVSYIIFED